MKHSYLPLKLKMRIWVNAKIKHHATYIEWPFSIDCSLCGDPIKGDTFIHYQVIEGYSFIKCEPFKECRVTLYHRGCAADTFSLLFK